jgi:Na+-translocating ferredoxin:NAD+ oxidoreductase RNF subunit RnfB
MAEFIIPAVLVLGLIGAIFGLLLYFIAQKFKVIEDPKIDEIAEVLPGANCGGCGMAGCRALAEAFVKQGNMEGLRCPAGGNTVAEKVAKILGIEAEQCDPQVAVIRCSPACTASSLKSTYQGLQSCAFANSVYVGENGCAYGCLGLGDCYKACQFDAITMDEATGTPKVDEEKCVGCGACVKACPRGVVELRNKGLKNRRVYVSCVNKDKGAMARKTCDNACIGCGKCAKVCPFEAITVLGNLAYIDYQKCKLCRKCESECPTGAIVAVNFPPKKEAPQPATVVNNENKEN